MTAAAPCEISQVATLSFVPLGHVISCPCCRSSHTTTTSTIQTGPASSPSYPEPTGFVCTEATQIGLEWGLDDGGQTYICTGELPPSTWGFHDMKDAAKASLANGFQNVLDLLPTVARNMEFDPKNRGHVIGTCNGRWICENSGALVDDSISLGCSQAPIDIALQLDLPDPSGNAFICTTETVQPTVARRVDAANSTTAPSSKPLLGGHTIAANVLDQSFASGSSGVFGVLFLAAMVSTLWYRHKYHQALATSQTTKAANKPKAQ